MEFDNIKEVMLSGLDLAACKLLSKYDRGLCGREIINLLKLAIWESDSPNVANYIFNDSSHSWKINKEQYNDIRIPCGKGYIGVIKIFLDCKIDDSIYYDTAFIIACRKGYQEIVKLLLSDKRIYPSIYEGDAIVKASAAGNAYIVKLLLNDPRVDPSDCHNNSILYASINGHIEVVKLLLNDPRVDPSANNNYSIVYASRNGHTEMVKLLLNDPRVDPSDDQNSAIFFASRAGHSEIVDLLLQDERVSKCLSKYAKNVILMFQDKKIYNKIGSKKRSIMIYEAAHQ